MELLATLSDINRLEKIINSNVDGVIFGSLFAIDYDYNIEQFRYICRALDAYSIKKYVVIDAIISEDDKVSLFSYLEIIKSLNFVGIYFHDLAVYEIASSYGLKDKLIYDGQGLLTNSLDPMFYLSKGIKGAVIARELTFKEIKNILRNNDGKLDMQIFGRHRLSYSKREFLTNYFNEVDKEITVKNNNSLSIKEDSRNYFMPIKENKYGTIIYSDYIFELYKELIELKPYIKRGIVSDILIEEHLFLKVLRDYKRITKDNIDFLWNSLLKEYSPSIFTKVYLYNPTVKEKNND